MRKSVLILALGALALGSPASANTTPIVVDVAADWTHEQTSLRFPPALAGFARSQIEDYTTSQLDIAATYQDAGSKSWASIYVFRAGLPDASLWHDRILAVIGRGALGLPDASGGVSTTFVPTGGASQSGIRTSLAMQGKVTASGVAIYAHGDWLVSVRMSSPTWTRGELDARLAAFTAAIGAQPDSQSQPPAYAIAPCADALPTKAAKRVKPDMTAALLAGALMGVIEDKKAEPESDETAAKAAPYCRDAASTGDYGVYRWGPARDGFVVAFQDAGTAATVVPDAMGALLGGAKGQYAMSLSMVNRRSSYAPFKGLPTVQQVVEAIGREQPMSSTSRGTGKDGDETITIGT